MIRLQRKDEMRMEVENDLAKALETIPTRIWKSWMRLVKRYCLSKVSLHTCCRPVWKNLRMSA